MAEIFRDETAEKLGCGSQKLERCLTARIQWQDLASPFAFFAIQVISLKSVCIFRNIYVFFGR